MSKQLYTLTVERDHFTKKAKELEQRQKTMELEFTASQYSNLNLGNPFLVSNHEITPSAAGISHLLNPTSPPVPGITNHLGSPFGHGPGMNPLSSMVPVIPPTATKIPSVSSNSPATVLNNNNLDLRPSGLSSVAYDLANPPPDIAKDDITMLISMGFNLDRPDQLFDLIRSHKGNISRVIEELLKKLK